MKTVITMFAILASPAFGLSAQKPPPIKPAVPVVSTMPGMGSLVLTLVATGWQDFFLDLRQPMGLTNRQVEQLSSIRERYVASLKPQVGALKQAELSLYHDMALNVVTSAKLGADVERIADLKASIPEAHFTAVLKAINVLDHQQHLQADTWMRVSLERALYDGPAKPDTYATATKQKRHKSRRFHWSSSFTPQQLLWKAW